MSSPSGPEANVRCVSLDGVRGLAILMVVFGHAGLAWNWAPFASAGVTLFFALSGYLITGVLIRDQDSGGIKFRQFYTRRATRLVPPLATMVACITVWSLPSWTAIGAVSTWTSNYARIAGLDVDVFGHTWSLAVEEQFYLLWPLVVAAMPRRRAVPVCAWLLTALIAWRALLHAFGVDWYAYHALETSAVAIVAGALVALGGWQFPAWSNGVLLALILAICVGASITGSDRAWMVVPLLVTLPAAGVIASAEHVRWLSSAPLAFFGLASYSIYLWHVPVGLLLNSGWRWDGVLTGAVTGVFAYLLVEAPLMRWRQRRRSASRMFTLARVGPEGLTAKAPSRHLASYRPPTPAAARAESIERDDRESSVVRIESNP